MSVNVDYEECAICQFSGNQSKCVDSKYVEVGTKGLVTLKLFCTKRKEDRLLEYLCSQEKVKVHIKCRRDFTDPKRLAKTSVEPPSKKQRLRSSSAGFNWKLNCFLCTKSASIDEKHLDRSHVIEVRTLQLRNTILQYCDVRNDQWSDDVKGRLQDCIDFVAAEAIYHKKCYSKFVNVRSTTLPGRPETSTLLDTFNQLCHWLENECDMELITLDEIYDKMKSLSDGHGEYTKKWLKFKLQQRFGNHLVFAEVDGKPNVLCFQDMVNYIINKKWYDERCHNAEDESLRIITTAAKLIRQEIRQMKLDVDFYPSTEDIMDSTRNNSWSPPLLRSLLSQIVPTEMKQASIGQCIVKAARPRTAIPPLLFGMGIEADHVFGSRWLIDELFKLGFSVSYSEVNRYKQSVVQTEDITQPNVNPYPEMFTQYVADNVDHNLITLDGSGSFHGMGVISVSTPLAGNFGIYKQENRVRRNKTLTSKDLTFKKGIPLHHYVPPFHSALSSINMKPIIELRKPFVPHDSNLDLLWQSSWFLSKSQDQRPNWSGYMQSVSTGKYSGISTVTFLPIIDLDPNNYSCIYSTLMFIDQQSHALNIVTPCITFDQPLWLKSMEIITAKSMNIVTRLGGFHLLMSFLGSVGKMMESSGIADVLETIYGSNTVKHMLSGKAISRALRGHFLVQSALMLQLLQPLIQSESSNITLERLENDSELELFTHLPEPLINIIQPLDDSDLEEIAGISAHVMENKTTIKCTESLSLQKLGEKLAIYKEYLSKESRTAKLWINYIDYIDVIKDFIRAERRGDWDGHLNAVRKMLNLFAATGHFNYAKSARLYLQTMYQLPDQHPWLHEQFINHGFHTIRRSDRFWAGLWSDLVIEQGLMRTLKDRGGLTRGRGMTEAVRLLWVYSMHKCSAIHGIMSEITHAKHITSEQHIELGTSRVARDNNDLGKIISWLLNSSPYIPIDPNLRCLHSGMTSIKSNDSINCEEAEYVGQQMQEKIDNKNFKAITFTKAECIKTLQHLQKSLVVENTNVNIDPTGLFMRLIIVGDRSNTIEECFEYELTQEPTSLFKDSFMRKPNKADLAKIIKHDVEHLTSIPRGKKVIDGGAFLHQVKWQKSFTYGEVFIQYGDYLEHRYGTCTVVFDGYDSGPSIKDHEHLRRNKISCPYIKIEINNIAHKDQNMFMTNEKNKSQFIHFLTEYLTERGFEVRLSINDADANIVKAAIELAVVENVIVVADDTDILVLLLHHFKDEVHDVFLYSEASRRSKEGPKIFNIRTLRSSMNQNVLKNILLIHAWSGCDTTSAIFGQGKSSVLKKFSSSEDLQNQSLTFYSRSASHSEISKAGIIIFSLLYTGKITNDLAKLRYNQYMNMVSKSKMQVKPELLPPTNTAADFHSYRVHLQVVEWDTFLQSGLDPTVWGWKLYNNCYSPITTTKDPAPQNILNLIRCKCKMSSKLPCSSNRCSCKKNGLWCMAACGDCHGDGCNNIKSDYEIENDSDMSDDGIEISEDFELFT